jgi:hypothetical protein
MADENTNPKLPKWADWLTLAFGATPWLVMFVSMTPWGKYVNEEPSLLTGAVIWLFPFFSFLSFLLVKRLGQSTLRNTIGALLAVAFLLLIAVFKNLSL